jgi:hypothetical protein
VKYRTAALTTAAMLNLVASETLDEGGSRKGKEGKMFTQTRVQNLCVVLDNAVCLS